MIDGATNRLFIALAALALSLLAAVGFGISLLFGSGITGWVGLGGSLIAAFISWWATLAR